MVYDTVCHDLGKTYPEVRKLHPAEILFHFHHAQRRKEERVDEINTILEYFMRLIQPKLYEEYVRLKDADEIQVSNYSEDMDEETFMHLVHAAESRFKPGVTPTQTVPVEEEEVQPMPEAASPPKRNPFKWGRPADLPPMIIGDGNQPPPEDTDYNPVSFQKWE